MVGRGGDDEGEAVYGYTLEHPSGAIERVYVRRVPETDAYPEGLHYRLHCGHADEDEPIIRFENGHGYGEHHKHAPGGLERIGFEGIAPLMEEFQMAIDEHERNYDRYRRYHNVHGPGGGECSDYT